MSNLAQPAPKFCYRDYASWPESVRGELIDGEFFAQAAPSMAHQRISAGVLTQFMNQLKGRRCRPYSAPTDVLLKRSDQASDDDSGTVLQPDLFIICDPTKITSRYLRGAPEFVLEILSPATARHDQVRKLRLYEQHGVQEFWTLDPETRVLMIYTQDRPNHYGPTQVLEATGTTPLAVVDKVIVDWDEVFDEPLPALG